MEDERFLKILVPVDGSDLSLMAEETAAIARWLVPKMVKNGYKSVFAHLSPQWTFLTNAFWQRSKTVNPEASSRF